VCLCCSCPLLPAAELTTEENCSLCDHWNRHLHTICDHAAWGCLAQLALKPARAPVPRPISTTGVCGPADGAAATSPPTTTRAPLPSPSSLPVSADSPPARGPGRLWGGGGCGGWRSHLRPTAARSQPLVPSCRAAPRAAPPRAAAHCRAAIRSTTRHWAHCIRLTATPPPDRRPCCLASTVAAASRPCCDCLPP